MLSRKWRYSWSNADRRLYYMFECMFFGMYWTITTESEGRILMTLYTQWMSQHAAVFPRYTLQWHHNERNGISNPRRLYCLLNCWFRRRSKKTSKLRVSALCAGNQFAGDRWIPRTKASNAENVSIWWRHHEDRIHETLSTRVPSN